MNDAEFAALKRAAVAATSRAPHTLDDDERRRTLDLIGRTVAEVRRRRASALQALRPASGSPGPESR